MSILPAPSFLVTWPPASPSLEKSWHRGCFPLPRAERERGTKQLSKALSLALLPPVMVVSQSGLQPDWLSVRLVSNLSFPVPSYPSSPVLQVMREILALTGLQEKLNCFFEEGRFEIQNLRWCKSKVNLRPKAEDDFGSQNTSLMSLIAWVTPNYQAVSSMIPCCCELQLPAASHHWLGCLEARSVETASVWEFPKSQRICTWVRTDLVFTLPIYQQTGVN